MSQDIDLTTTYGLHNNTVHTFRDDIFKFEKVVNDAFAVNITFLNNDPQNPYTISGMDVTAYDEDDQDVSSDLIAQSASYTANKAKVFLKDGVVGKAYRINAQATMTNGDTRTKRLIMLVVK